jgi:hypothetical protein
MKITKSLLKEIIKEELENILNEVSPTRRQAAERRWGKKGSQAIRDRKAAEQGDVDARARLARAKRRTVQGQRAARRKEAKRTSTIAPIMDPNIGTQASKKVATKESLKEEFYEVDAKDVNEEYCPVCAEAQLEEKKKKACKPSKGKRFAKRVDGKCRSFGQKGQAKGGGDRIRPGTAKGDAYCARSAGIKKCKNPPCANTLSRKKWRCRGKKSMKA